MTIINITHGEDPDGICCAAILRYLIDAKIFLTNYDTLEKVLTNVNPKVDEIFITDLNIRQELLDIISHIRNFAKVTIIDHHPLTKNVQKNILDMGITLIYDTRDCATCLLFNLYRKVLPNEAARLAAYAAISDMFDNGPIATSILARLDRKLTQHQALILTHAMQFDNSYEFRERILVELSSFILPHRIPGVVDAALAFLEDSCKIMDRLPYQSKMMGRLAFMDCSVEKNTGSIANLILDKLGVDVGVCYKIDNNSVNISLRGERTLKEHLGELAHDLAKKFGGYGGGHHRASGAKIPKEKLNEFIKELSNKLG